MSEEKDIAGIAGGLIPVVPQQRVAWVAAMLTSIELVLLPFVVHLDGKPHAGWEQFLGRFHPLAVHLPIGLVVLVPVLEIMGRRRKALRETVGFVLGLAFAASLLALALGFLLAHGSGEASPLVSRHMWGGIAVSIFLLHCLLARPLWLTGSAPRVYPAFLVCSLLALAWTAHQGGSITYGTGYLTEYLPGPVKRMLPPGSAESADSFYAQRIHPIFDANCVSCHGAGKTEAGLRLDSYDSILRGGKDGAVIVAGKPEKSPLLERVSLPPTDEHRMPAGGRAPLRQEEIALIKSWIEQGASPSATSLAGIAAPETVKEPPPEPVGDYSALMPEIRAMQKGVGVRLLPMSSKASDGLVLYTVDVAGSFGDAQLAGFKRFAPYIVEAELGRTAVTDASFDTIATFTHLRALHLEGTGVTGGGLEKLKPLTQLTYINLSGTHVTAASAAPLSAMKNLSHEYLFDTPAQPGPAPDAAPAATANAQ